METTLWLTILLILCLLLGIILTCLNLPGNLLIFLTVLAYGFYENFNNITYELLLILLLLWLTGELAEFLTGAWAIKKVHASKNTFKAAIVGAVIGSMLGTAIIPILGSMLGAIAGAFVASYLAEYQETLDFKKSKQVAFRAAKGQLIGTVLKIIIAFIMAATIIYHLKW